MNGLCRRFFPALACVLALYQAAHARAFEDSMAERTLACTACHGEQGRAGPDGYYPRLAGKPAGYLYNQLESFRAGRSRHYPLMTGLLDRLSTPYLGAIAQYFSELDLPYAPPIAASATPAVLARGKLLASQGDEALGIPACSQCHGTALTGVLPSTPGLMGLPRDYLNAQLGGWKTGQRHARTPDCMARIAQKLDASDISAITSWLASQAPPPHARAATSRPALAPGVAAIECGSDARAEATASVPPAQVARGTYLARIGNCALCHTARGGAAYAGGRGIDTPFGTVFSSNITPDPAFGIGQWSADDFWNALHHGKSKNGRWLYPAFPYTSYTLITRDDSDALFAFLRAVPASAQTPPAHTLRWPYSTQAALGVWRALFFTPGAPIVEIAQAPADADLQRGAYLVQGLGHCYECHAKRNALGAISRDASASGTTLPANHWYAPSLTHPTQASVADWQLEDIAALLTTGTSSQGVASGPMAEVVLHGTQYLTSADALSMARYLKSLPIVPDSTADRRVPAMEPSVGTGQQVYEKHCAGCHGTSGQGQPKAYPALARNRAVVLANTNNLILTVLYGGFAPATASNPRPFGMPPFMLQLGNKEIAAALTYIRTGWGNQAPAVSEFDVHRLRTSLTP